MRCRSRKMTAAVLLLGVMSLPSVAHADRQIPAQACQPASQGSYPLLEVSRWISGSITAGIYCPYIDTTNDWKTSVATVYVDGDDGSSTTSVQLEVCSDNYDGSGGQCGSVITSGNSYVGSTTAIGLSATGTDVTNAWGSSFFNDYGYVTIILPPNSDLRGLYIVNS
jgi:hypothetical protein